MSDISILAADGSYEPNTGSNAISILAEDGSLMANDGTNGISILDDTGALRTNDPGNTYSILSADGSLKPYEEGNTYSIMAADGSRNMPSGVAGLPSSEPYVLYVSPDGNDTWTGTSSTLSGPDGPFQTITAAQTAARARLAEMEAETVDRQTLRVKLLPGTYYLEDTLAFDSTDSGVVGYPVIYEAETPDTVVISGGVELSVSASDADSVTYTSPTVAADYWVRAPQLYVDGRRAILARHPNVGAYWFVETEVSEKESFTSHANEAEDYLNALSTDDKDRAFLNIYQSWSVGKHRFTLASASDPIVVSPDTDWAFMSLGGDSQRLYVENVEAALDDDGEWFGNDTSIQYLKRTDDSSTTAILPLLETLVTINGGAELVEYFQLKNIQFEHAVNLTPDAGLMDAQAAVDATAAIVVDSARNVRIDSCSATRLGGFAFWFRNNVRNSLITHCTMTDLGCGGVKLGEVWYDGVETNLDGLSTDATGNNTVTQNVITDTGKVWAGAAGIWAGQTWDNTISNNLVARTTYTAISLGWQWGYTTPWSGRNTVSRNLMYNIGQGELGDMGAIYTVGPALDNRIEYNVIREVRGYPNYGVSAWGIYGDDGTTETEVVGNVVVGTDGGGYHLNHGMDVLVEGNLFALGDDAEIRTSAGTPSETNVTIKDNLFLPLSLDLFDILEPGNTTIVYDNNTISEDEASGTVDSGDCGAECSLNNFSISQDTSPRDLEFLVSPVATPGVDLASIVAAAGPDWGVTGEVVDMTPPTPVTHPEEPAPDLYGPEIFTAPADLSNAAWTKLNVTVTNNNAANSSSTPNSADTILETTTTGAHRIYVSGNTREAGETYKFEVVIKANGRDLFDLEISDNATGAVAALFNIPAVNATDTSYGGTWGALTSSIVALGNDFYRCSIEASSPGSGSDFVAILLFRNGSFSNSYAGSTSAGMIVESASLKKLL